MYVCFCVGECSGNGISNTDTCTKDHLQRAEEEQLQNFLKKFLYEFGKGKNQGSQQWNQIPSPRRMEQIVYSLTCCLFLFSSQI